MTRQQTYQRPQAERLRDGVGHVQYECVWFYKQGGLLLEMYQKPTPTGVAADVWEMLQTAVLEAWF